MIETITKTTLHAMLEMHRTELRLYEQVLKSGVNCRECVHSDKGTPSSCRRWGLIPPPDVQAVGCDEWQYDHIPF
jgi:hypothetical protein